jgi:GAF domain-containing protein
MPKRSESPSDLKLVVQERDALRRVTKLIAGAVPPDEVFAAVVSEAGRLLECDYATLSRCEPDSARTILASWPRTHQGLFEDDFRQDFGVRGTVGVPITAEGRLWGVLLVEARDANTLLPDTEERLTGFTELVGMAVAIADARQKLDSYAEEWAALHRVARLVAKATSPEELFASVAREVGQVLRADGAMVSRYEADGTPIVLGAWARVDTGRPAPIGLRLEADASSVPRLLARTLPVRINDEVAAPIVVENRLWGVVSVGSDGEEGLPPMTEQRLHGFCGLLAAGIATAEV